MFNDWVNHCTELAKTPQEGGKAGIKVFKRKLLRFNPGPVTLSDFGYSIKNPHKFKQLMCYYHNEVSMEKAARHLARPGDISVGVTLQGKEKTFTQQDFCMQTMVIERAKDIYTVTVFHRNTELIKKFGADLVFIKHLMEKLGVPENTEVYFFLNNITINAMFYPLLIPYQHKWKNHLLEVKSKDKSFYRNTIKWLNRYMHEDEQNYRFVRRVQQSLPRLYTEELYQEVSTFVNKEFKYVG
jgi:hypothetical protein